VGKAESFWSMCDFLQEMDQAGINKNVNSFSIYMNALSKGGKPGKALKLNQMLLRTIQPSMRLVTVKGWISPFDYGKK
jgi:hypothetical protein